MIEMKHVEGQKRELIYIGGSKCFEEPLFPRGTIVSLG